MTHRQILALAGWLAEHSATLVERRRGIPVSALRNYLTARQEQYQAWCEILRTDRSYFGGQDGRQGGDATDRLLATLEEIATAGVLVRVTSTLLHTIGIKMDIPLAIDVAAQAARGFARTVLSAMAAVARCPVIDAERVSKADRLGNSCDRMSDLLCGVMLPLTQCDRYAVDAARAADFAGTFGRRPALARIPLQSATKSVPERILHADLARAVEQAIFECLAVKGPLRDGVPQCHTRLDMRESSRILPLERSERSGNPPAHPLLFPVLSFARSARKLTLDLRRSDFRRTGL